MIRWIYVYNYLMQVMFIIITICMSVSVSTVAIWFRKHIQCWLWCQMVTLGTHLTHAESNFEISIFLPFISVTKNIPLGKNGRFSLKWGLSVSKAYMVDSFYCRDQLFVYFLYSDIHGGSICFMAKYSTRECSHSEYLIE